MSASSGTCSRFLLSSKSAASRVFSLSRSAMYWRVRRLSSETTVSRGFSCAWLAARALTALWAPAMRL